MIDLWMQAKTDMRFDPDGQHARAGRVDEAALAALLDHPYFAAPGPKSLDRYDFALTPVEHLSLEDGAATLTAFTAETVAMAVRAAAEPPKVLIASGGGRLNPRADGRHHRPCGRAGDHGGGVGLARRRHRGGGLRLPRRPHGEGAADFISGHHGRAAAHDGRTDRSALVTDQKSGSSAAMRLSR